MSEENYKVINVEKLDPSILKNFIESNFNKNKSNFLINHGKWLYNGNRNRYVVLKKDKPVGYFGLIPSKINIQGKEYKTFVSMDLYIPTQYRGRGIMKVIDNYAKSKDSIIISFPNIISYKIYKKYGYNLSNKNSIMVFPIKPFQILNHKNFNNLSKYILRSIFFIFEPLFFFFRKWYKTKNIKYSRELTSPSARILENIFKKNPKNIVTTVRDESFINWRYFNSPFFSQYNFFIGGKDVSESIALVTRTLNHKGVIVTRIIDIFGNLNDKDGVTDLIKIAVKSSIKKNSAYITSYVSLSSFFFLMLKIGFFPISKSRFRCWNNSSVIVNEIMEKNSHWSLVDSDNDSFD